jgi:hypothetical protein
MTETRMVSGIEDDWHKADLPRNKPMDVARIIAGRLSDIAEWRGIYELTSASRSHGR